MPNPAVAAIARWEWARRWRTLVVLGLIGGLLGGLVVAGVVLIRRTVSAPDRLIEEVAPGDAHLRLLDPSLLDAVLVLPQIESVWTGGLAVGRIEGAPVLSYAAIVAPTVDGGELMRPVIIEGRAADPTDPAEVVVAEEMASEAGLTVGQSLRLAMLTVEEMFQFDTGFGDPDGPTVDLRIVGLARVPPGVLDNTPVVGTPAFADAYADLFSGYDVRLSLRGGDRAYAAVAEAIDALAGTHDAPDDFPPVTVSRPRDATDDLLHSSRVLFAGLIATVTIAGLAVAAGLAQAWARHHGASAYTQHVEAALGLPTSGRVLARTWPAIVAAAIAGLVAAGVGVLASWAEPLGSLRRVEPQSGWRPDLLAVVAGGLVAGVAVILLAAGTAWRAGRPLPAPHARRRARRLRAVPSRGGWPLTGAAFAVGPGGGRRAPVRTSLVAAVVGVAGLVGSVGFDASLDRLVDTPRRWGWDADFAVVDSTDAVLEELLADDRLVAVSDLYEAQVRVEQHDVFGYAVRKRRGDTGWVFQAGRHPASPSEMAIGRKLADDLGARVGDQVSVGPGSTLTVVGIGLGPSVNREDLGRAALFTVEGLEAVGTTTLFREAIARVAPGVDVGSVVADYRRYETTERVAPPEVRDLSELGALPITLGSFLALLAAITLGHALMVTASSRAKDLAVLQALGATPHQAGLSLVGMALTTAAIGIVGGVPLGLGLCRLLWGEVARSIGVQGDIAVPATVVLVVVGVVAAAVLMAVIPALRTSRRPVGPALRAD